MKRGSKEIENLKSQTLIKFKGNEVFNNGELNGVCVIKESSEYVLTLLKEDNIYKRVGTYISEKIDVEGFTNLILSWNCKTPESTYIEVLARAYVVERNKTVGKWSDYLSWGKWGTTINSSSTNSECEFAKINTDVFLINDKINNIAKKFQVKINLYTKDQRLTPSVTQLSATFIDLVEDNKFFSKDTNKICYEKIIETPCFSQYEREKSIAPRICSPTSLTMVLNRMGEKLNVEEVAWSCYDYKYNGFGNWAFNVAFAGSLDYESYIQYGSFEILQREILKGYPVITSVKYTNNINNPEYPYIENSPLTTDGHLIVVCGITSDRNGQAYIVVNDPAGKTNESVRRSYKLEDFLAAWNKSNNIMYVINRKI